MQEKSRPSLELSQENLVNAILDYSIHITTDGVRCYILHGTSTYGENTIIGHMTMANLQSMVLYLYGFVNDAKTSVAPMCMSDNMVFSSTIDGTAGVKVDEQSFFDPRENAQIHVPEHYIFTKPSEWQGTSSQLMVYTVINTTPSMPLHMSKFKPMSISNDKGFFGSVVMESPIYDIASVIYSGALSAYDKIEAYEEFLASSPEDQRATLEGDSEVSLKLDEIIDLMPYNDATPSRDQIHELAARVFHYIDEGRGFDPLLSSLRSDPDTVVALKEMLCQE